MILFVNNNSGILFNFLEKVGIYITSASGNIALLGKALYIFHHKFKTLIGYSKSKYLWTWGSNISKGVSGSGDVDKVIAGSSPIRTKR